MNYAVERFDSLNAMIAVHPLLASASHRPEIFQTPAWSALLQASGFASPPAVVWLLAHDDESATLFAMPLLASSAEAMLAGMSNFYCSLFGPLGNCQTAPEGLWQAMGRAMRRLHPRGVVSLQPLAREGAFYRGMTTGMRAAGFLVDTFFCFGNWYLPVLGQSFAAYFSALPAPLRNSIERGRRRLHRSGGWNCTITTGTQGRVEDAIAEFVAVYNQSWKEPEPCPAFVPDLIRTAAREGWLRLGVLRLAGLPIAVQLWLVTGGKANIYKLAYVRGYERFSPGSVLTAALMEHVIDVDRVHEVDFLTGDDAYKRDWMSYRRERVGLVAFDPRTLRGLAGAARHWAGRLRTRARQLRRQKSQLPAVPEDRAPVVLAAEAVQHSASPGSRPPRSGA